MFKIKDIPLAILFFLFFIPTSSKIGGYYLWFFLFLFFLFFFIIKKKNISYTKPYHQAVLIYVAVSSLCLLLSILGAQSFNLGDLNEFIRFFAYILIFGCVFSYLPNTSSELNIFALKLLSLIKFVLIIQLVAVLIQINTSVLSLMDIVWDMNKFWPLRRIGTFNNPNTLSTVVLICYSYICIFEKKKAHIILFFCISLAIIGLSGSRTGLVAFLLVSLLNYFQRNKITFKMIVYLTCFAVVFGVALVSFLEKYKTEFAYMAEILEMFEKGGVNTSSVTTMSIRERIWDNALDIFDNGGVYTFYLGTGPGKGTSLHIIDNDYLTIYIKTGIIGVIVNTIFWLGSLIFFYRNRELLFSKVSISIIFIFSIFAMTGPVFASWYLTLFFFCFYAFAVKELKLDENDKCNYSNI